MGDLPAAAYGWATAAMSAQSVNSALEQNSIQAANAAIGMLPPHFPDPNANPIAILQARIVELEEINAAQYAEMTAWRTQLEVALAKLAALENKDRPE